MNTTTLAAQQHEERMHRRGVITVTVLWVPIIVWMLHLGTMAALVRYVDNHPSRWWLFWIDTGIAAAVTIACILTALFVGLTSEATEADGTPEGRTRFLAWQAVLAGFANLALILAEGSYVAFLTAAHR